MLFLILLAALALVAIAATLFQMLTDGYRQVPDRPGTAPAERR